MNKDDHGGWAYGDEWTNMLQPFWALALLGITRLKDEERSWVAPWWFLWCALSCSSSDFCISPCENGTGK